MINFNTLLGRNAHKSNETIQSYRSSFGKVAVLASILTLFLVFFSSNAKAQCTNCNGNYPGGTFSTTSSAWSTVGTNIYGGEYAYYNVSVGSTYVWTTCGLASYDTQLTLRQGSNCYGTYIAYSDDACGAQSQITWTATFTGTVTVLLSQYSCLSNGTNTRIDWRCSNYVPPAPACTPPAVPGFGNNVWNVLCYDDNNFSTFKGYYTENNVNFNSAARWGTLDTPSNANGASGSAYSGCPIGIENHSVSYKRQGFPAGTYSININRDDEYILLVDGIQVNSGGCCGWTNNTWTGNLGSASTVEIKMREYTGGSQIQADFAAPSYCIPSTASTCCMGISQVVFNTINNYSGTTNNIYQNFISLTTNIEAGTTTNLSITGWTYGQYASVWVDLNNNYVFEPSERLATGVYMYTNCNVNITIPNGTSIGNHRMRIRTEYEGYGAINDPCSTVQYGETEDYTINVTAPCVPPSTVGFGTNTWNVLGYEHTAYNFGNIGTLAGNTFKGYYTDATVDINSQAIWNTNSTPSSAAGWTGCPVSIELHTVVYKRQGFPTAYYQIDLNNNDDGLECYVNGTLVYQINACCADQGVIWSGVLCSTSTVEFRVMEGTGGSNLLVDFIDVPFTAGTISGAQTFCPSATAVLTASGNTGGSWSSSNGAVATVDATGLVSAIGSGSATIIYTVNGGACGNATTNLPITVVAGASAGVLSGTQTACVGATTAFTSNGTAGGSWSSSDGAIATVSATGLVSAIAAGSATITYTVLGTGGCPNATATRIVTVSVTPTADAGLDAVLCPGQTTVLNGTSSMADTYSYTLYMYDSYGDGWNGGYLTAFINGAQVGTYAAGGYGSTATIIVTAGQTLYFTYTSANYESENSYSIALNGATVYSTGTYPATGNIYTNNSHPQTVFYAWSPPTALSSSSILTPTCSATGTTTYTLSVTKNGCTATNDVLVTVYPGGNAGVLSGTQAACIGATTAFTSNGTAGGTWSSSDVAIATVSATGLVSAIAAGSATITYIVLGTGGCPNATATRIVTVSVTPTADAGLDAVLCPGQTTVLNGTSSMADTYSYTLYMYDSYGDGWNGGYLTAFINGAQVGTYAAGGYGSTATIIVTAGQTLYFTYTSANYEDENSYSIALNGATVYSTGTYPATGNIYTNNSHPQTVFYAWSPPTALSSSSILTPTCSATGTTTYTLSVTKNGCSSSDNVTVSINTATPASVVTASGISLATGDLLWSGNSSTVWGSNTNWYAYDGTNFVIPGIGLAPTALDRVFVLPSSTSGICVSATNNTTVTAAGAAKDVFIGTGATMVINPSQILQVNGNWTNNGTFTQDATATVEFTGGDPQTLGGSSVNNFTNLTLNKSGNSLTLNTPATVSGTLTMTSGNIATTTANLLTVGTAAETQGSIAWTGGSVLGPIKRYFSGTASLTQPSGIFPVGYLNLVSGLVSNRNAQVNYTLNLGTGGSITAEYKSGETPVDDIVIPNLPGADIIYQNYAGLPAFVNGHMIQNYENEGYWEITPGTLLGAEIGDLNTAQYSLKLRGNNLTTVSSLPAMSQLRMIKSTSHTSWDNVGIGEYSYPADIDLTGGVSDFTITNRLMTGFSWFNIGSGQISWLPIELLNFAANCNEKSQVELNWSTASEQNSANFIIERSRDLTQWEYVSTTNAAGNSNYNIDYSALDTDPLAGVSYYRLVQLDINGTEKIYGPISVSCAGNYNSIVVFPNPTKGNFTVEISSTEMFTNAQLQITDLTGKIIHQRSTNILEGKNQFTFEGLDLQLGTYIIQLNSVNGKINPVRIVVQ